MSSALSPSWISGTRYTDQTRFVPAAATKKATDSHGSLLTSPKLSMIAGCTSATIVLSKAKRKVDARTEETANAHLKPCTFRGEISGSKVAMPFSADATSPWSEFPEEDGNGVSKPGLVSKVEGTASVDCSSDFHSYSGSAIAEDATGMRR